MIRPLSRMAFRMKARRMAIIDSIKITKDDSVIYIYNDFGGTHTTALAAAYHF